MPEINNNTNKLPDSSSIKQSGFSRFLSTLFGWRQSSGSSRDRGNVEFTQVDLGGKDQRIGQAFIANAPNLKGAMGQKLDQLFEIWLNDNTDKMEELTQRSYRINQLEFAYLNDCYINKAVEMMADESTQLDQQDTIIEIDTPDARMTKDMYKLLNQWGITQNRVRETIRQLALYGDGFWANTVTERGVERIMPLQQLQISDRIEFNPIKALELKKKREGFFGKFSSNNYLISQMLDSLQDSSSFSDMFDTKLFGFSIDQELTVPAWSVTHFRVGGEGSAFYPWGTSPIMGSLAPYKQTQTAIALQSLAKELNFPITIFSVKTDENMDEGSQFAVVNRVREEYDNIGVSQQVGNSEVYTVNTKIWVPKDLLEVEVKKASESGSDNVDAIKLYQDRTAISLGIPKSFFGEEGWKSLGHSGKSLIQQYKPFARKCFTIQSAFIEGLADLFRLHFAITGIYDFRVPFTLSMKYPAIEEDSEFVDSKNSSLELASNVIDMVKSAIGAGDDEGLPADIVREIIGKYTFLDPADIMKWTRDSKYKVNVDIDTNGGSRMGDSGGEGPSMDISTDTSGGGSDEGGIDMGAIADNTPEVAEESRKMPKSEKIELRLREYENRPMTEAQKIREKELKDRFKECKGDIYFNALKECGVNTFTRRDRHVEVFNTENTHTDIMLEVLNSQHKSEKLVEGFTRPKTRKKKINK